MATWVAGTALASGALITQAWVQNVANGQRFLAANDATYGRDFAQLRRSATQSVTASTYTAVSFDTEDIDLVDGHGTANPTRYTARAGGKYLVSGAFTMTYSIGTPTIIGVFRKNGTGSSITGFQTPSFTRINLPSSGNNTIVLPPTIITMQGTSTNGTATTPDYIEMMVWSNGTTNVIDETYGACQMTVQWVAA